jgi:hypothetical protein
MQVLAALPPDADAASVLVALKNSTLKRAGGEGSPILFNGRPWRGVCKQPGCGLKHPYFMHQQLTGKPLTPELQFKVDEFEARKREKAKDPKPKADAKMVAVATTSDADDDTDGSEYGVGTYFVGMLTDAAGRAHPFDNDHILLDSQAGTSMMKDASHLTDIRAMPRPKHIHGVAGEGGSMLTATEDGLFMGWGRVPIVPGAAANILAQRDCRAWALQVELDHANDTYTVSDGMGKNLVFTLLDGFDAHYAALIPDHVLVTTVAAQLAKYSPQQQKKAAEARQLQVRLGLQSSQRTAETLRHIDNTGVTAHDIARADTIAGKALAKVRGGTKQQAQITARVECAERSSPEPATAEIDVMFIHGIAFLVYVLLPLGYIMAAHLKHRTVAEIGDAIKLCNGQARARDFDVQLIRCDGEGAVAAYTPELNRDGVKVDTTAAGEHCGLLE